LIKKVNEFLSISLQAPGSMAAMIFLSLLGWNISSEAYRVLFLKKI